MSKTRHRNGVRHSDLVHAQAIQLRRDGKTHGEIADELGISKGTAHLWTRGVALRPKQRIALRTRSLIAAAHSFTPERREKLGRYARIRFAKYTRQTLLDKIIAFYHENGRIPLKREFNMYREYARHFNSWNAAIRTAGFDTNPQTFSHKFTARDGHRCDSFSEKIIDDWLAANDISYERNWRYPDTRMTADFIVGIWIVIEFFGLAGAQERYDELIDTKRKLCGKFGIVLIELYPRDIFPKNRLTEKIKVLNSSALPKPLRALPS